MGTRALVRVFNGKAKPVELVCLYRQYDGYPDGLGEEVVDFVGPLTVTNGIQGDGGGTANGAGCLAAQLVAHLKDRVGGVYLHEPGTSDVGEEYEYRVLCPNTHEVEAGDTKAQVQFFSVRQGKATPWVEEETEP